MAKVKYLSVKKGEEVDIHQFPNFDKSGSITGMKRLYYGKNALLVRCGNYIFNVTQRPDIYEMAK
jgi:hypothetical protein